MRVIGWKKILAFYFVMMGVALAAMAWQDLLHSIFPRSLGGWLLHGGIGIAVGLLGVGLSRFAYGRFLWAKRLSDEFRHLLGDLNRREALAAAVLSGVGEELLFRGVLQPALGLWIAAAVFGLLHTGPNTRFLPWTVMAFGAGLLFGAMVLWTGNLLAPMLAHFVINFLNLRFLAEDPVEPLIFGADRQSFDATTLHPENHES